MAMQKKKKGKALCTTSQPVSAAFVSAKGFPAYIFWMVWLQNHSPMPLSLTACSIFFMMSLGIAFRLTM